MVREGLSLGVNEASIEAPLARDEGKRWRAAIEHAVDAARFGAVQRGTSIDQPRGSLEVFQKFATGANVGVTRK
jgi:hypothetical protein